MRMALVHFLPSREWSGFDKIKAITAEPQDLPVNNFFP